MKIKSEKKAKKYLPLPPKIARQIELLKKYYDIDDEKRVIYVVLHYSSVSEVLATDISCKGAPHFSRAILNRVSDLLDTFPAGFDVDLTLKFDDYEGYEPSLLMSAFKDNLEMVHYSCYKEKKYNYLLAAILAAVSAALIGARLFAMNNKLIDGSGVLQEMIDISAWVFLWEAVTIIFLSVSEKMEIATKVISHLSAISFVDKTGKLVGSVSHKELVSSWLFETKPQRSGRIVLLIAGAATFALGILSFFDGLTALITVLKPAQAEPSEQINIISVILLVLMGICFIEAIIYCFAGIGALMMFREKGKFQKFVPIFAWVMFVFDLILIGFRIFNFIQSKTVTFDGVFNLISSTIVTILYFTGYQITKKNKYIVSHHEE